MTDASGYSISPLAQLYYNCWQCGILTDEEFLSWCKMPPMQVST